MTNKKPAPKNILDIIGEDLLERYTRRGVSPGAGHVGVDAYNQCCGLGILKLDCCPDAICSVEHVADALGYSRDHAHDFASGFDDGMLTVNPGVLSWPDNAYGVGRRAAEFLRTDVG